MNLNLSDVRSRLESRLPEMKELIEHLVNIDSGSHDKEGVDHVASILASKLLDLGFDITKIKNSNCGDFIYGQKKFNGKGRLLILGHTDTVWPKGTAAKWPYQEISDDIATGPGVGDMKGGLVMALFALDLLIQDKFDDLESITFALVPDEELGSVNSRQNIENLAKNSDYCLVLEPGRPGNGVATARGALGNLFMHAHGRTAHCALNYTEGASAVKALAMKVYDLENLSNHDLGVVVNVGVFTGGVAKQVVPETAMLNIDVRARTQEQADELLNKINQIASREDVNRVSVEITGGLTRPAFTTENNRDLYAHANQISKELDAEIFEVPPTPGGSDGNFTAAMGLPTLDGLGPVSHNICSLQETMEIPTLVTRGAMFYEIINTFSVNNRGI